MPHLSIGVTPPAPERHIQQEDEVYSVWLRCGGVKRRMPRIYYAKQMNVYIIYIYIYTYILSIFCICTCVSCLCLRSGKQTLICKFRKTLANGRSWEIFRHQDSLLKGVWGFVNVSNPNLSVKPFFLAKIWKTQESRICGYVNWVWCYLVDGPLGTKYTAIIICQAHPHTKGEALWTLVKACLNQSYSFIN